MSGNLYLMSDVHGYFIPFLQILEKIRFEDADRMVILGDLVAKGPDSLGLLRFVMEHKIILSLRGIHVLNSGYYSILEQTARPGSRIPRCGPGWPETGRGSSGR